MSKKMCDCQVRSLSFRPYRGPTGGPGGSNALLEIYNKQYGIIPGLTCFYREPPPPWLNFLHRILSRLPGRESLVQELIRRRAGRRFVRRAIKSAPEGTLFVAHEVWSSAELANAGKPYVLVYHQQGSLVEERRSFGRDLSDAEVNNLVALEVKAFLNAHRVVFTSSGARDSYVQTSLLTKEQIESIRSRSTVIYNSCYVPAESVKPREFRVVDSRLAEDPSKKLILTVSSLTHLKGVDRIPAFLSQFENFESDFIWILCGKGPLEEEVRSLVEQHGLEDSFVHIRRRMPQEELKYLYRRATCYLMMHRLSIFDLATLEAMANGCVLILTATGGNLEFNRNGNVLFARELGDRLPTDEIQLSNLGEENQSVFKHYFGPENLLRGYAELIEDACRTLIGPQGSQKRAG